MTTCTAPVSFAPLCTHTENLVRRVVRHGGMTSGGVGIQMAPIVLALLRINMFSESQWASLVCNF